MRSCYYLLMPSLAEIDEVLIRYADTLSPEAISFKIEGALSPAGVRRRIVQLTEAPDWLSATQQDQLVTLKMRQIVAELLDQPRTTRNAEVALAGLERIGNRLDKRQETTEADLNKLYSFQGVVLYEAVEKALAHMRGQLTAGNPDFELIWDNALENALRYAQLELAKHEELTQ